LIEYVYIDIEMFYLRNWKFHTAC